MGLAAPGVSWRECSVPSQASVLRALPEVALGPPAAHAPSTAAPAARRGPSIGGSADSLGTTPLSQTTALPQTLVCDLVLPKLRLPEILLSAKSTQRASFFSFTFVSHFLLLLRKSRFDPVNGHLEMGLLHQGVKRLEFRGLLPSWAPWAPPGLPQAFLLPLLSCQGLLLFSPKELVRFCGFWAVFVDSPDLC